MELFTDLPQTTQIGIGLAVLLLLTLLIALAIRQRRVVAVKPADEANRSERKRRRMRRADKDAGKTPRRKRRKLAQEAAHAMGHAPVVPDADIEISTTPPAAGIEATVAASAAPAVPEVPGASATVVDVKHDPYVMVDAEAPPVPVAGAVAQPGWPSPGELASGFDPDAFDPLPPEAESISDDHSDTPPSAIDAGEMADTQAIAIADSGEDWDSDDEFDPASGWIDEESPASTAAAIWGDSPADADDDATTPDVPAGEDDRVELVGDADWDDEDQDELASADVQWTETQPPAMAAESVPAGAPEAPVWGDDDEFWDRDEPAAEPEMIAVTPGATAEWDEDDDAPAAWSGEDWQDATVEDEPSVTVTPADAPVIAFESPNATDDALGADAEDDDPDPDPDLAVPFPLPGTLPAHEATVTDVLASEPSPMPALSGRIDAGPGAPVVIDLASLVAHGDRVQVVIEHDEHGNGVRLRFETGSQTPAAEPPAAVEVLLDADVPGAEVDDVPADPAVDDTDRDVPADEIDDAGTAAEPAPVAPYEPINVPFLMGEAPASEASPSTDPWEPVDHDDHAAEHNDLTTPQVHQLDDAGEISVNVGVSDEHLDDPTRILADIRARLAALDARRFGD